MAEAVKKRKSLHSRVEVGENEAECVFENSASIEKPTVKKRNRYTFQDKEKILEESKNLTSHEICTKYGLSDGVFRRWKRNKDIIKDAAKKDRTKTLKKLTQTNEVDTELFKWLDDCRRYGIPVSGPMLCRQALTINTRIGGSQNFKASHGWLDKWKQRFLTKKSKSTGGKLSADEEAADRYKVKFAKLVAQKKLERAQIFNMDESGLMYKSTPKRTFVPGDHTQTPDAKQQLERVTIATCCNADGSCMLPLILIGKSKNLQYLKSVNKNYLPIWYRSEKNAWMNPEIFEEWFKDVFVSRVEAFLNAKNIPMSAILLVNNCKSYGYMKINDIEIHFFPPNVTSLIQPMDQGIIQTVKLNYEINLVNAILEAQNENMPLIEFLKTVDVYNVIFWIADAWEKVKPTTIYRFWKKLWPIEVKDVSTQTDECLYTTVNLDASVGTDVNYTPLSADARNVNDLLNLVRKVEGYELVDAATVLNWTQKTEKEEEIEES